jgi:hypothetical protein
MSWLNKSKKRRRDTVLDQDAGSSKPKSKKSKRNAGLGQDDEDLGATSNASSTPSLVAAMAPAMGTSSVASGSRQTRSRTRKHPSHASQPPTTATDSDETTKQSQTKSTRRDPGSRPLGQRIRDGAIIALSFASIISEATDLLKPVKAISVEIKKVLEITKACSSS